MMTSLIRYSTKRQRALFLEQGVGLVVIKELLGQGHIGVTATLYAHVRLRLRLRLRLQHDAIDPLGRALDHP